MLDLQGVKNKLVTMQGFEPRTSSSVVRCSIQLSYIAIPYFGAANISRSFFKRAYKISSLYSGRKHIGNIWFTLLAFLRALVVFRVANLCVKILM